MGLPSRETGHRAGATVLTGLLISILLAFAGTADAAGIVDRGGPSPKVSGGSPASVVGRAVAAPASADTIWTPERMASARPAGMPAPEAAFDIPAPGAASASAAAAASTFATGDFTPGNVTSFPQVVHGRIFFTIGAGTFSCSGTLVESLNRNVVFTAGHCVYDVASKSWVQNLIFVPGYENQVEPFGRATATFLYTTGQWIKSGSGSYDIGVLTLDRPLEEELGARKLAFDLSPKFRSGRARPYTVYGYPAKPANLFNGEVLQACRTLAYGRDRIGGNLAPLPIRAAPCKMRQGASGGGWVTLGNYLNSVVSYGYCDEIKSLCGNVFGPYFSNAARSLYVRAGGAAAPTVELLKAPPKVVRKRKVNFSFGGKFSTLPGFACKLDRKPEGGCSANTSIVRLTPGKHTLRVRAIDQTGQFSRRKIFHEFRVVLPRN